MATNRSSGERRHDPLEGVTPNGMIVTGAARHRVPGPYEAVLDAAVDAVMAARGDASIYLYGSVATGMAAVPRSDVDLTTIGLAPDLAASLSARLSDRFRDVCRAVGVGAGQLADYEGAGWGPYGNRVFLRHYSVHLAGPDRHSHLPGFAADAAAARGFNGDLARYARRWRTDLSDGVDAGALARRVGRKSLFAVAGLVSVHDHTWTTDRVTAGDRWAEVEPHLADGLRELASWGDGIVTPDAEEISSALDGIVTAISESFDERIGLWKDDPP